MPSTSERFDLLDLHDAPILAIERTHDGISLRLGHANLRAEHPANPEPTAVCVQPCVLLLRDVAGERARLFDDAAQAWVAHADAAAPLSGEIVEARQVSADAVTSYRFAGMHTAGWSEWEVTAGGFTLTWERVSGEAWFVGWPR